jgi:hypothetical protein
MDAQRNIGKDSVVIGNVHGNVGDRSVVIGATDARGNTILNQPMAVGYRASAGPGSIAIGAYANAGADFQNALRELADLVASGNDVKLSADFQKFRAEISAPTPDRGRVMIVWGLIKSAAAINGALALIGRIEAFLQT